MRNWNDFLSEFVLQAMTRAEVTSASDEAYYLRVSIRMAREAWDAIQAAELPESEKAKQAPAPSFVSTDAIALIASNSTELKALVIRTALYIFSDNANWVAIDKDGEVWAYDLKPTVNELSHCWGNSVDDGFSWKIGIVAPPEDFRQEIYEISKILSDDL